MARKKTTEAPTEPVSGAVATEPAPPQPPSTASAVTLSAPATLTSDAAGGQGSNSGTSTAESGLAPESAALPANTIPVPGSGDSSVTDGQGRAGAQDLIGDESASTASAEVQAPENPNPAIVNIYPMRTYLDEGELRRRGGPAYAVPRRHADVLVQKNLASLMPLKE